MVRITKLILATLLICSLSDQALAHREFKKVFEKHYAELFENDTFKKTFRKAKCNLCHLKGQKKDVNNPYGDALASFIEGRAEERLKKLDVRLNEKAAEIVCLAE